MEKNYEKPVLELIQFTAMSDMQTAPSESQPVLDPDQLPIA